MNRYVAVLEKIITGLPSAEQEVRNSVYERARNAIYETFSGPDNADVRAEEFRLLDEAIKTIEGKVRDGTFPPPKATLTKPEADRVSQPATPSEQPPAGPATAPPSSSATSGPDAPPPRSAARERLVAIAGGSLFAEAKPAYLEADREINGNETTTPSRLQVAGLLIVMALAGGLLMLRPDFLASPSPPLLPPQQAAAPARSPVVRLQELQWSGGERGGKVSWTSELDQSSFAPRRTTRNVLVGRADLRPLAPPVTLYFLPAGEDGARATHYLELRFDEDERLGISMVQSIKLSLGNQDATEPEGVVIRTGPRSFALVFSSVPKEAIINEALMSQAEEIVVALRLENGATPTVNIQTVKLK